MAALKSNWERFRSASDIALFRAFSSQWQSLVGVNRLRMVTRTEAAPLARRLRLVAAYISCQPLGVCPNLRASSWRPLV